ncbi:hypothetical protein V5O48_014191 [Marasmius crinis-equi]|uniref:Uncharacterized protein n=1 Tax=Marasmius crinis-equi TaxID=585013 RepID=A0ABR3EY38_9AGAR
MAVWKLLTWLKGFPEEGEQQRPFTDLLQPIRDWDRLANSSARPTEQGEKDKQNRQDENAEDEVEEEEELEGVEEDEEDEVEDDEGICWNDPNLWRCRIRDLLADTLYLPLFYIFSPRSSLAKC